MNDTDRVIAAIRNLVDSGFTETQALAILNAADALLPHAKMVDLLPWPMRIVEKLKMFFRGKRRKQK